MISVLTILDGLYYASILYLLSLGLNLIFGVSRVLNLAHGAFYAFGAYVTAWFLGIIVGSYGGVYLPILVVIGILLGPLTVSAISILLERGVIRLLYNSPLERQLLATYGSLLIFSDLIKMIWGGNIIVASQPISILGTMYIFEYSYPIYYIILIISSFAIGVLVNLFIYNTKYGALIRAVSLDSEMSSSLGLNVEKIRMLSFVIAASLAGIAGSLVVPIISATLGMESEPLILAFIISVIGGLGSFWGALIGSILIGILRSITIAFFPEIELALIFLIASVVLIVRPKGIWGASS